MPGGYVGVDVFFVISGFLIVGSLSRGLISTGRVNLIDFWRRRIIRLLPSSMLVLLASIVALYVNMPPALWAANLRQIAGSGLYFQNWILASQKSNYFTTNLPASLTQHFWSLSVEEQFYIATPLALALLLVTLRLLALMGLVTTRAASQRHVLGVVAVITVASAVVSLAITRSNPELAYLSTLTRAWEFGAGGLLAVAWHASTRAPARRYSLPAGWIGLGLIGLASVTFSGDTAFPGLTAGIPVLGALLIIWSGEDSHPWAWSSIAKFGPVQFLGDISYALYLWHWPLIVLYPYFTGHPYGKTGGIMIAIASIVLAGATTFWFENPIRTARLGGGRWPFVWAAVSAAAVLLVVLGGVIHVGKEQAEIKAENRQPFTASELRAEVSTSLQDSKWAMPDHSPGSSERGDMHNRCLISDSTDASVRHCSVNDLDSPRVAIVVGDSFALHLILGLELALGDEWTIVSLANNQCPFSSIPVARDSEVVPWELCSRHRTAVLQALPQQHPDLLVISDSSMNSAWRGFPGTSLTAEEKRRAYISGLRDSLAAIESADIPTLVVTGPLKFSCSSTQPATPRPLTCGPTRDNDVQDLLEREKEDLAEEFGLTVLPLDQLVCSEEHVCPNQLGNLLVSSDGSHFDVSFSRLLAPIFRDSIDRALSGDHD